MSKFAVILAAAGRSVRFEDAYYKKIYAPLAGRPLWMYAAEAFSNRDDVGQIVMVISQEDRAYFEEKFAGNAAMLGVQIVIGGTERADSVLNGLQQIRDEFPLVAVHDAARPCITGAWIDAVFSVAKQTGAAILASPCQATLKRVGKDQTIVETVSRASIWMAQTPQVFRTKLLRDAYAKHPHPGQATDDASIVEQYGHPVKIVPCSQLNLKVTTKEDLKLAELALKAVPKSKPFPFG